ncbi:hypothetical protein C8F04DRAFT_1259905 [Mycena alexandri]|uniref:Uncharacterized protein n=1 Tax=Mycena alexandri TaxID=1745969 RepID=A0AAD6SVX2_9AGAR|nr:hypothetical protein C8F04DRAFT_1259905 [Mycena alexandri]
MSDTSLDLSSLVASLPESDEVSKPGLDSLASNQTAHCFPPQLRRKLPRGMAATAQNLNPDASLSGEELEFTAKLEGGQRAHAINTLRRRALAAESTATQGRDAVDVDAMEIDSHAGRSS